MLRMQSQKSRRAHAQGVEQSALELKQALYHPSQTLVARVAMSVGWLKVWDEALDRGPTGSLAPLSILKLLCKTVFTDRKCPVELCNDHLAVHLTITF